MRRLPLAIGGALVLVGGVVAALATQSLPEAHKVARSARYKVPKEDAWTAVADLAGQVAWRPDLQAVERLADTRGHEVWREDGPDGTLTLETVEVLPNRRMIRCVTDQGGPFGGCWTVEVAPRSDGSVVTITENLSIHSLAWRVLHPLPTRKARLDDYLLGLGEKFGDTPILADLPRELNDAVLKKKAEGG